MNEAADRHDDPADTVVDLGIRGLAMRRVRLRRRYLDVAGSAEGDHIVDQLNRLDHALLTMPASDAEELMIKLTLASNVGDQIEELAAATMSGILADVQRLTGQPPLPADLAEALRLV